FRPLFGQPAQSRTLRSQFWQAATQAGDPDAWMLRFLRARGWRVDAALGMLLRALRWRAAQAIDELVFYGESRLHFRMMHSGLAFACTRDRLGLPVYVVRVRANVARGHSVRAVKRFLCWQMETAQLLAAGRADGRITLVFDMSAFTRENIDLQLVRTLITLLANYYPETLGILLLHVNSLLFSGLWALIAPFIDPAVKSKIVMTRTAADLAPFIDSAQLVAELGGPKRFVYDYALPTPDENACMADAPARAAAERAFADAVHAYEAHTSAWAAADALQPDGPGRAAARDRLRAAGRALDPYVRARTLYHRAGVVAPDHSVAL
ncbi:phosphatidylinositol transfer protein csr1, partial [Coemansia sp. RSA 2708]